MGNLVSITVCKSFPMTLQLVIYENTFVLTFVRFCNEKSTEKTREAFFTWCTRLLLVIITKSKTYNKESNYLN